LNVVDTKAVERKKSFLNLGPQIIRLVPVHEWYLSGVLNPLPTFGTQPQIDLDQVMTLARDLPYIYEKTITFRNPTRVETLNTNPNVLHQSLEIFTAKNKNNSNCVRAGKKLSILNVSLGCIGPILYTRPGDPSPQQGGQSLLRRTTPDLGSRFDPNNPSWHAVYIQIAVSNYYLLFVKRMRRRLGWMSFFGL
jgi:hypothetical protein